MKKELVDGLERWGKQVLDVQDNNMRQAKITVDNKKNVRRQRSREERRSRETRVKERRKESKEREDEDLKMRRVAIETKDKRVNKEIQINYFIVRF